MHVVFPNIHVKKVLSILLFLISSVSFAQELEEVNNSGYIDVSHGLMVSQQTFRRVVSVSSDGTINYNTAVFTEHSLYALDASGKPSILLLADYNSDTEFKILPGTTRIAKGAFKRYSDRGWRIAPTVLIIPSSIKYIPEDLFEDVVRNIPYIIIDNSVPDTVYEVKQDNEQKPKDATEVARYNVLGQRIDERAKGIQIIHYDNGSSRKMTKK